MDTGSSRYKKIFFSAVSLLLLVGYGYFVYAAAPLGGYTPGSTLDPDCAPLDTDCVVTLSTGTSGWALTGNAGTVDGTNFIGTTDAVDFVVKVNGNEMARFFNNTGTSANSVALGGAIVNATNMFAVGNGAGNSSSTLHDTVLIGNNAGNGATNVYYATFIGFEAGMGAINSQSANFLGFQAGKNATNANGSNFFGQESGSGATFAWNSNFLGSNTGKNATGASNSNFFGYGSGEGGSFAASSNFFGSNSGNGATNAYQSNFFGYESGLSATGANNSNFLGAASGKNATGANNANFFGYRSGEGATGAFQSNFIGIQAGLNATGANNSNFFGFYAGNGATGARVSNFIGYGAGYISTNAIVSNFIGWSAGGEAPNANYSNFMGREAGYSADNASQSNFFGPYAGRFADNANNSNFIGYYAGHAATSASFSNFIGSSSGNGAINASYSTFIGQSAGLNAANARNSIFIGQSAGNGDSVNNTGDTDDFSILIGKGTSTGGFSNSIALGGSAVNTASNQFMIGSTVRPITSMILTGDYTGGSCTFAVGGMSCSSDERLKTNIENLPSTLLDTLIKIRTVTYNWNSNATGSKQIGFIAQDLQQYFPQLVSVGQGGYLQVNYAQMTPILVEAIRELNLNITSLTYMDKTNPLRDALIAWFGNAANGITQLYVKVFHADRGEFRNEVCLGQEGNQTCVTKEQLDYLLQNNPQIINTTPVDVNQSTLPEVGNSSDTPTDPVVDTSNQDVNNNLVTNESPDTGTVSE